MPSKQKSRAHAPSRHVVPLLIAAIGGMTIAYCLVTLPMPTSSERESFAESPPYRLPTVRRIKAPLPAPKPAARSKLPSGVRIYLASSQQQAYGLLSGVNLLNEQFQALNSDPAQITSERWIRRSAAGCAMLTAASSGLQHLSPVPGACRSLNQGLQRLGAAGEQFAVSFGRGVDTADAPALREVVGGSGSLYQQAMQVFSDTNRLKSRYEALPDEEGAFPVGENAVVEADNE